MFIRPKSKKKIRETIKPLKKRTSGRSLPAIAAMLRLKLQGFFNYLKHVSPEELAGVDGWIRGRLRSILRKRAGGKGRGRGLDHQRRPNHYFTKLGFFNLEAARKLESISLREAVND